MINKPNLLFVYMVPHTGHEKAAEAVMEAIRLMDPSIHLEQTELARRAFPVLGDVFNQMYLQFIQKTPFLWDFLYDNPDVDGLTREVRTLLMEASSYRTRAIVKKTNPDGVVCTQAVAASVFAQEKKRGRLKAPLVGILTDFGVHRYWIHPEIDLYLVAHEDTRNKLVRRGIPKRKIQVAGIPVHPQFGILSDRPRHRQKHLLLLGGGRGLGLIEELVESLLPLKKNHHLTVVCGRNDRLRKRLLKLLRGVENALILGYVDDMARLMKSSDLIITKPGGLSVSEALASQTPMMVTSPLPGQEERNVRFLTRHKAAFVLRKTTSARDAVRMLLDQPAKRRALKKNAAALARPLSAWESARHILNLIRGL